MRRPRQMPTKGSIISAASLCLVATLSGCSTASPADKPASVTGAPSAPAAVAFTVAGVNPVAPNGSQDTHAQTPTAPCDGATFETDKALGAKVADGFALANFPAAADLLRHFLNGKGTGVNYPAGSP